MTVRAGARPGLSAAAWFGAAILPREAVQQYLNAHERDPEQDDVAEDGRQHGGQRSVGHAVTVHQSGLRGDASGFVRET